MFLSFLLLLLSGGTVDTVHDPLIDCGNVLALIIKGKPDTTMDHLTPEERE
jgi:hypothetical protein